jgi:cellulase/cellobiase CelA1
MRLTDPRNLGQSARIDGYDPARGVQPELLASYVEFGPDLVVLLGGAELVSTLLVPLEQQLLAAGEPAPHYLLGDATKVPELLQAARQRGDLGARLRGVGALPGSRTEPAHAAFLRAYARRYPGADTSVSGLAAAHDAIYALAFGAVGLDAISGSGIARGLRRLAGSGPELIAHSGSLSEIFAALSAGASPQIVGSLTSFSWDDRGTVRDGNVGVWCVALDARGAQLARAGLSYDVATQTTTGSYAACAANSVDQAVAAPAPGRGGDDMDAGTSAPTSAEAGAPPPIDSATPPAVEEPRMADGVVLVLHVDTDWRDGYCESGVVDNIGADTIDWWVRVTVDDGAIGQYWDSEIDRNRGVVTFRGADHNRTLESGASTRFGFCVRRN